MTPTPRLAQPEDIPDIAAMMGGLAAHHGDHPQIDHTQLTRDILGPTPWFHVIVAEDHNRDLVGYAALIPNGQLQMGKRGMDVHHMFVHAHVRGTGVGTCLMDAAAQLAAARECAVLTVGTHPDNAHAAQFYDNRGFERMEAQGPRFLKRLSQPPT